MLPRVSATIAGLTDFFAKEWPTSYRDLAAGRRRAGAAFECSGTRRWPRPGKRIIAEAEAQGDGREAQIEAARDAFYQGFVAEAIDDYLPQRRGDGCQRQPPQGRAHRRRHGATGRPPSRRRRPTTITAGRSPRPAPGDRGRCFLQTLAILEGLRYRGDGPGRRGFRPHRRRGDEARLRRPRGLLRRSRISRRAARRTCCPRTMPPSAAS